jgi:hypothetical protein
LSIVSICDEQSTISFDCESFRDYLLFNLLFLSFIDVDNLALLIKHLIDVLKDNFWSPFAKGTDNVRILGVSDASSSSLSA